MGKETAQRNTASYGDGDQVDHPVTGFTKNPGNLGAMVFERIPSRSDHSWIFEMFF